MAIKAILWDIGGVLIEDPRAGEFWKNTAESKELRNLFGTGKLSKEKFIQEGAKILGTSEKLFQEEYAKSYFSIKKLVAVCLLLEKTKGKNYIFSDTNPLHTEFIKKTYPEIFKLVKKSFLSHEIKKRKDEESAYKEIISELNLRPEEILFIDNKQEILDFAIKTGIKTLRYENHGQLSKELKALKLI